jgi:hypothetical protein
MTKPITILIFFVLAMQLTHAQVGINTMDPKPSAALDIRSIEKGLLIPCMSSDNRLNIVNPADGLMVYETIQHTTKISIHVTDDAHSSSFIIYND